MCSNVIISNVISLALRYIDTDSENASLIRRSASDGQQNMHFKKSIIDRYIIKSHSVYHQKPQNETN